MIYFECNADIATKEKGKAMRNLSAICKKRFKQMLYPYGYSNKKSVFVKLEDDIFFIIAAKGRLTRERSAIWTFASPFLYCNDIAPDDFDLRELVDNMFFILQRIKPDKFTLEYYYNYLIKAADEEDSLRSLDSICDVIEEFVLPYIHRFTDLEYYYNELLIPESHNVVNSPIVLSKDELFFLLIKLRKYENALINIDNQIEDYRNHSSRMRAEIDASKKEEWNYRRNESSIEDGRLSTDEIAGLKLRELYRTSRENAIIVYENKICQLQETKELVLAKDYNYFDNYIKDVENKSRASLRDVLNS